MVKARSHLVRLTKVFFRQASRRDTVVILTTDLGLRMCFYGKENKTFGPASVSLGNNMKMIDLWRRQ